MLSEHGFSARDMCNVAHNGWIDDLLKKKGAKFSGKELPPSRIQASSQQKYPPVTVYEDGSKGKGEGSPKGKGK